MVKKNNKRRKKAVTPPSRPKKSRKVSISSEDSSTDSSDGDFKQNNSDEIQLLSKSLREIDKDDELSSDEDNQEKAVGEGDLVNLDFAFCDFDDNDFHLLKMMLVQNKNPLSSIPALSDHFSDLADKIVSNKATGTVVRANDFKNEVGEASEICGFISILHLYRYNSEQSWSKVLVEVVKDLIGNLDINKVGILITDRLINMPDQIGAALHKNILEDLTWAQENTSSLNLEKDAFEFSHLILFSKALLEGSERIYFSLEDETFRKKLKSSVALSVQTIDGAKICFEAGIISLNDYKMAVSELEVS